MRGEMAMRGASVGKPFLRRFLAGGAVPDALPTLRYRPMWVRSSENSGWADDAKIVDPYSHHWYCDFTLGVALALLKHIKT